MAGRRSLGLADIHCRRRSGYGRSHPIGQRRRHRNQRRQWRRRRQLGPGDQSDSSNPAVSGSTTGALDLQQSALGGAAGRSDTGTAGVAGNAVSILVVQDNTASSLSGLTQAYGGTGGSTMTGTATPGGNATSKVNLTSTVYGAPVNAAADAYAGRAAPRARRDKMPYPARRSPMRPSRHTAALKTPPSPSRGPCRRMTRRRARSW